MTKTQAQVEKIFMKKFNGQGNFMTPTVIEYGQVGPYLYELSSGDSLSSRQGKLYGVTVLTLDGERADGKSQCMHSMVEAVDYVRELAGMEL